MARSETRPRSVDLDLITRLALQTSRVIQSGLPFYLVLGGIFLFGAWLRLTALDRQSLWFDEADVVIRAQRDLMTVLRDFVRPGENGPLYNLLLYGWMRVAGSSEIAVRLPSAIAGVLSLPLMYHLGTRTLGRRVGLFAAGLLAISPYHVWYSQEAKMYAIVLLLTLVSTTLFVEALSRNQRIWWVGYVVATTLAFYFHVTTVLVFATQSAFFLLTWRRWAGRHRPWLISAAALTLPYVPIALWAGRVILGAATMWQSHVSLPEMVQITSTKFAVNRADLITEERGTRLYAVLAVVGLVGAGLLGWGDQIRERANRATTERFTQEQRSRRWMLLFGLLVGLPVVGLYLLTFRQPLFNDRYLIMALPAYLLLVAAGIRVLERRFWPLAIVALVLLLGYAWVPLRDVNRTTLTQKEDWRPAYATIAAQAEPDDLLLIHPGYLITTAEYYAQRINGLDELEMTTIPSFRVEGFDAHQMALFVREDAPGERIWLVQSPDRVSNEDPNAALETWLESGGDPLYHQLLNGVEIALYELPPPELDPAP